jgi:hypothetical protein
LFTILPTTLTATGEPDGEGFVLFQNEPNPFGESTVIRFRLPEATAATLTVFGADGKTLFRHTAAYGQGAQTLTLGKSDHSAPGVLFYKLEAGANVAWRKMLLWK